MRPATGALAVLCLLLAIGAPAIAFAQEEPLTAGSEGVPVPKKVKHVQPVYPAEALAQGIRGIVILDIVVDAHGRVASTSVLRSVAGLDEAAIAAARQWEYEPAKVGGKPVSVRVTVPITFSLALPRITRQPGVPELRQGVPPSFPAAGGASGSAAAEVTLEADGRIADTRLVAGEAPWSEALLAALRTWRFAATPDDAVVSFRVEADFVRSRGSEPNAVQLRANGLQRSDLLGAASAQAPAEPPGAPSLPPAAQPPSLPAAAPAEPAVPGASTPVPAPAPPATKAATPEPASTPAETGAPRVPPPTGAAAPQGAAAGPAPAAVAPPAPPAPKAPSSEPSSKPAEAAAGTVAPPAVEVLTAPAPAVPPENGISAVRDVTLEAGVPELATGRRPVAPPLARLNGTTGAVEVAFSVGAGGNTAVQSTPGPPDVLRYAAEQTVASWMFRRTRADRAYLVAVFTYSGDKATALVRPQAAPPAAPGTEAAPGDSAKESGAAPTGSAARPADAPPKAPATQQPPPLG